MVSAQAGRDGVGIAVLDTTQKVLEYITATVTTVLYVQPVGSNVVGSFDAGWH
jgi:hypothetical protein